MIKLDPGDLLIDEDNSYAILLERVATLGVGAWRVFWDSGREDLFPWVETSIQSNIQDGTLKHIKGDC
jgi:hypothetical protein|tara:strand:+ start:70 stop:273 length:204 start_codon:yes stop_codon:yes gene_type:complete